MKDALKRLLKHLVPTGSVVQRTVKSGIWVSVTNVSSRLLQVLMIVVLARLLSPEAFGLVGIALLALAAVRRFTSIGISAALIQKKEENVDEYLNTTWCLEFGRGFLIFAALFTAAPFIASFFDESRATDLIRAIAVVPAIYGLRNPGVVYFQKDLAFHRELVYKTGGAFVQVAVGIGYALYSPTVWALVLASIARPTAKTVLSYALHDYRPRPTFDTDVARDLIGFGKWMTGASIVGWLIRSGDDAFVGWFVSATALGFYQYAYRLADMPATEMSNTISRVTFPAYSRVQEDTDDLQRALLQSTRFIAFLAFPMSFGIALVAPSFIPAILGEQWEPMVLTMQILALYGLCHAITGNYGELWKTLNRPDYIFKISLFRVFLVALLIWPATARWGIEGTAAVVTGVYVFPVLPIDVYLAADLAGLRSMQLYEEYVYPFVASATMFGSLWFARGFLDVSPLVEFLVLVPAGAVVYLAVAILLERQFDWGIRRNLRIVSDGIRG